MPCIDDFDRRVGLVPPSLQSMELDGSGRSPMTKTTAKIIAVGRSPTFPGARCVTYMPHRKDAVCRGASHSDSIEASTALTVMEQPAISSEVT
jgi:hypothetical protein